MNYSKMLNSLKKRKVIFVGGVHGVGKTTFCKALKAQLDVQHFSASDLIAREKKEQYFQDKRVQNIDENQDVLVTALNKYLKDETWYLLDGHFCLLSKDGEITKIPDSTYEGINPCAIILLFDRPENIYDRLSERDNITYDLALLHSFQEQEIDYAKYISNKLGIPYRMCDSAQTKSETYCFVENLIM
ncbi:AAA family ATPase [Trichocoleus sp. FACHB-591]|uniref:ATP-binding protein n=1 Tax=Trichocoleus sp. FACHB-591 TaxID=2692872 RepID=UPI001684849E|nr:ATP-binding protein [Trichocoleus sp. FACHB-591]MBD2096231.1 AAA family ATPase [Trichocoleus sp. FACHB-591]